MTIKLIISIFLFYILSSCGTILQRQATKNYKDPICKTKTYKVLNSKQQDFLYLKTICEKYFPNIDEYFHKNERLELETIIFNKFKNEKLTDKDFRIYLTKYLSHFNNQHTSISWKGIIENEMYPFIVSHQDSSWYVFNLTQHYNAQLIGQKITEFNDIPINIYEKKLFEFVSAENLPSKRKSIRNWWYLPTLHEFINKTKLDSVKLTFENGKSLWIKKELSKNTKWHLKNSDFKEHSVTKNKDRNFDYEIIDSLKTTYFQFHSCYDKIEIKEGMKSYVKPYLIPIANLYVNNQLKKKKVSKRLRKYFDSERPIFNQYIEKMITESNAKGIKNLVIDLRNNNGGSEMICLQLLYHLTEKDNHTDFSVFVKNLDFYKHYFGNEFKNIASNNSLQNIKNNDSLIFVGYSNSTKFLFDKIININSPYYVPPNRTIFKGKIIVLANYTTASAAALFTTMLQDNNIAEVIGTEVSNNPTAPTTWTPLKLPNSKLDFSISSRYLVRPDSKKGRNFIPDILLEKSFDDILNGKDPLFDKAIEILNLK